MGWSLDDLAQSSPGEVIHALNWRRHYDNQKEKSLWEAVRLLGYWTLQPYDSKKKLKSPGDLLTYSWEEVKEKAIKLSPQEMEARRQKFARWDEEERKRNGSE